MEIYTDEAGIKYTIELTHISNIRNGDTIEHEGILKTVSDNNIKSDLFMGISIFGDSYMSGRKPVKRAHIIHVKPNISKA